MKIQIEADGYQPRKNGLLLLQCVVGIFFCIFLSRFWYLQVHKSDEFIRESRNNRLRDELIYATRGVIQDVNGVLLAENRTAFGLALVLEDCPDTQAALAQVSQWAEMPLDRLQAKFNQDRQQAKPFEPILLLTDLPFRKVMLIEPQLLQWPGLQIVTHSKRTYPHADVFAHILGYVGEVNPKERQADPALALRDTIGKQGIEVVFDQMLRGFKGRYSVDVDSVGRALGRDMVVAPINGNSLVLNIDARLQHAIVNILGEQTGSVVVLEPETGAVRALVTTPAYDNNLFIGGMSQTDWQTLQENPRKPFLNRAIQSAYPPGSVWKLMMAGMILEKGISPDQKVLCTGEVKLDNQTFRCWRRGGHGQVNLRESLVHSCDVYYYVMGERLGIENIESFARNCGFGAPTGIELPYEKSGLVPSREWKRRVTKGKERWQRGETLNVSIGQGATLTTPLQVASFIGALLNDGKLMQPRLIAGTEPKVRASIPLTKDHLRFLVEAMQATVEAPGATARVLKREDAIIGGKTGTAQVVKLRMVGDRRLKAEEVEYFERDHAWMASWGQRDGKTIVVVAMIEHGGGGSSVAGPVVREVYDAYYALEDNIPYAGLMNRAATYD